MLLSSALLIQCLLVLGSNKNLLLSPSCLFSSLLSTDQESQWRRLPLPKTPVFWSLPDYLPLFLKICSCHFASCRLDCIIKNHGWNFYVNVFDSSSRSTLIKLLKEIQQEPKSSKIYSQHWNCKNISLSEHESSAQLLYRCKLSKVEINPTSFNFLREIKVKGMFLNLFY